MTKSSKDENFVQTFDFAGKTITLEDAEPLSDDEQDNFIEFKASEKIPEIHVEGDEDGPARYVYKGFRKVKVLRKVNNAHLFRAGASGETNSTSSSLASPSPLGSATCGGSPTSATKMEEVSFLTIIHHQKKKTFSLRKISISIETADHSETL